MGEIRHFCQDIKGALMHWKARNWKGICRNNDGQIMTPDEVKMFFLDQLAMGHEVYPLGPCDNFDWKRGCLGHPEKR